MDRFDFARKEFPRLVQRHFDELKVKDKSATYERALRETALKFHDLYEDYAHVKSFE